MSCDQQPRELEASRKGWEVPPNHPICTTLGPWHGNLNFDFSGFLGVFENTLLLHKNSVLLESLGLSVVSVSFTEVVLMAMKEKKNKTTQQLGK